MYNRRQICNAPGTSVTEDEGTESDEGITEGTGPSGTSEGDEGTPPPALGHTSLIDSLTKIRMKHCIHVIS